MQRNGQNPIRAARTYGHNGKAFHDSSPESVNHSTGTVLCHVCKTPVPPKPGFRISALKCPKCGASMAKK